MVAISLESRNWTAKFSSSSLIGVLIIRPR